MGRRLACVSVLALSAALLFSAPTRGQATAQDPAPSPAPSQPAASSPTQPSAKPSPPGPTPPKSTKVWTNENLADATGPVSVVGDPKKPAKRATGSAQPGDPQYIAATRKQLEKWQTEIADSDKKLAELKSFIAGESVPYNGYQYRKGYDREPVDAQMRDLEEKKKQTQAKIDALLEEARKKGIEPGQLR